MVVFTVRHVIIALVSVNIAKPLRSETLETSDFSKVVKSKYFFDKSMLIKEILTYKYMHITCPRQFGKTTNLDMVKRFLEVNLDEAGDPIQGREIMKTENYKLFQDNNLKIFQKTHFFKTHFGKYPVIFMDYSDFRRITDFTSVLSIYKTIVRRAFNKHTYVLQNTTWAGNTKVNMSKFDTFCSGDVSLSTENDIKMAFEYLLSILFDYFKKQPYIIIDNYDSHIDSLIFKNVPDLDKILTFILTINEHLLNDNHNLIYGALLTGVLRLSTVLPTLPRTDILHFKFYLDHVFSEYYGVTQYELKDMLKTLLPDVAGRNRTIETIDGHYKAYKISTQHTRMYNVLSIVRFLESGKADSYWCRPGSFDMFRSVLGQELVKERIETLLSGENLWASVPNPFFNEEIINLNKLLLKKEVDIDTDLIDLLFVIFYHFGFLSPSTDLSYYSIALKIPNREVFDELDRTMQAMR